MPHIMIDYSGNLDAHADVAGLCEVLRRTAIETGIFPEAGVRVRATPAAHVAIADGHPDNAFLDISVRLRQGRTTAAKQAAATALFDAARAHLGAAIARLPIALSLEIRDIDARLAPKLNTIRDHMKARA